MSDEPSSPADFDLARIAGVTSARHDRYFFELVTLADNNLSTAVGLLVNGVFITGILTSAKAMADEVDQARTWLADQRRRRQDPKEPVTDELEQGFEEFATAASKAFERNQEAIAKVHEEAEPYAGDDEFSFDRAPAALSRRLIKLSQRAFITLKDVQIVAPGQIGMAQLPVLRVALAHIGAWWIIQLDDDGRASFQLFRVDEGK